VVAGADMAAHLVEFALGQVLPGCEFLLLVNAMMSIVGYMLAILEAF